MTGKLLDTGSANSIGELPYAFWYQTQKNIVHDDYVNTQGFPFIMENRITDHVSAIYCKSQEYDAVFASTEFAHWNVQGVADTPIIRNIPGPWDSILAGTD